MELTVSTYTKLGVLAVILVIFAVVGWRVGAPNDFQSTLASAGLAQQPPAATAPAPAPATQEPSAPAAAPQTPAQPAPQPESSDNGH